jgi:transposase
MTAYMKEFLVGSEFAAIDLSEIFTYSGGVNAAMLGHNHKDEYRPQINLALVFSLDKTQPGFFRMIPGSIRDVSTVVATIQELDLKEIVFIGDKGFSSEDNVQAFSAGELKYILPLKRNSTLIDYGIIKKGIRKEFDGVFQFDKRHIWHYTQKSGKEQVITFLDEKLKAEETSTLIYAINQLQNKDETAENTKRIEGYQSRVYEKDYILGTIAVRTTCDKSAQEVYGLLKSRMDIEKAFNVFKNILEADKNYMRGDKQLEGFLFVSFIALQFYYRIYEKLIEKELLDNYSVQDVIEYLKRVHLLKIGGKTQLAEIPKKSRKLLEKLEYVLPEEPITKKG